MMCGNRRDFLSAIAPCRGSEVTGGAASCPQLLDATLAYGAECLALPMFENGPPFGYSACPGEGGMVALCEQAGFKGRSPPVRPSASPGSGTGSSPGTLTKLGYGAAGLAGIAGAYTAVGAVLYYGPENKPTYTVSQLNTTGGTLPYDYETRTQTFREFLKNRLQRNKKIYRDATKVTSW